MHRKLIPFLIALALLTLFFVLGSIYPYHIDTDVAVQLKAVQQWLKGESGLFYSVAIADPNDLSKTVQNWITFWSPGLAALFVPLLAIGVPIGIAGKFLSYVLVISGCLGWLKIAEWFHLTFLARSLLAITLSLYSLGYATSIGVLNLTGGDVLPFGVLPWLHLYCLHVVEWTSTKPQKKLMINASILGFLLGGICWLKYSSFLVSIGLLSYLTISLLVVKYSVSLSRRLIIIGLTTITCLIPFLTFSVVNHVLSPLANYDGIFDRTFVSPFGIILSILGGLGLSLFQVGDVLTHIFYFSDLLPDKTLGDIIFRHHILTASGIPFTLATMWIFWYARKIYSRTIFLYSACIILIPFVGLLYLSVRLGYNFIVQGFADITRHSVGFAPLIQIIAISVLVNVVNDCLQRVKEREFNHLMPSLMKLSVILVPLLLASLYLLGSFAKSGVVERLGKPYIATANQLYTPELSTHNVAAVVRQIDQLVTSPQDVVAIAAPQDLFESFWLEIDHRLIPTISSTWIRIYPQALSHLPTQLKTSQDLRLVLVISKYRAENPQEFEYITRQFPQATEWKHQPTGDDASVDLWYAILKA